MKKNFLLILVLLALTNVNAQIGGISASKTTTINAYTVDKNCIEFEPSFSIFNNSEMFENSFNWRFSYGLFSNFEIGMSMPSSMEAISFGAKFFIVNAVFFKLSPIAGINFNFSQSNFFDNAGLGFASTFDFSDNFSTDIDFHIMSNFSNKNIVSVGFDNGLFVGSTQLMFGTNYLFNSAEKQKSQFFVNPGVTLEAAKNFLIVATLPVQILGQKSYGFGFALTIMMN